MAALFRWVFLIGAPLKTSPTHRVYLFSSAAVRPLGLPPSTPNPAAEKAHRQAWSDAEWKEVGLLQYFSDQLRHERSLVPSLALYKNRHHIRIQFPAPTVFIEKVYCILLGQALAHDIEISGHRQVPN